MTNFGYELTNNMMSFNILEPTQNRASHNSGQRFSSFENMQADIQTQSILGTSAKRLPSALTNQ